MKHPAVSATVVPELHRAGLALVLAVLFAAQAVVRASIVGEPVWSVLLAAAAGVMSALPLLTVGRWPAASVAVIAAATVAFRVVGGSGSLIWIGPVVATYVAANTFGRRAGGITALVCAAALTLPPSAGLTGVGTLVDMARNLVLTGAAAAFGEANRARKERAVEAEARAAASEEARLAEAARAVEEERLRIARELHDVTAHSLSVISIQSELARATLRSEPDEADRALRAIGDTSRQALGELRAMLGQLRDAGADGAPSPSLRDIEGLAAGMRGYGITIDVAVDEDCAATPFTEAMAFRIVQEALTNAVRHSQASVIRVEVGCASDQLAIRVIDDGVGGAMSPGGHGLVGMSERAASVGGVLTAGPMDSGGWRVEARLPLRTERGAGR